MDKKLEVIVSVLQQQRNNALDQIANLVAEITVLQEKLKELEKDAASSGDAA